MMRYIHHRCATLDRSARCRRPSPWFFSVALLPAVVLMAPPTSTFAADRYVYHSGGEARYCSPPASYSEGYFIVRDEPGVVRVNGYPVISTSRAEELCATVSVVTPPASGNSDSSCCSDQPGGADCLPRITDPCNCHAGPKNTPITFQPGKLKAKCEVEPFYAGIGDIAGTIPVPIVCIVAQEEYQFRPLDLNYSCKDADGSADPDCQEIDCDHENCHDDNCRVASCEVFNKREVCRKRCEMCPRTGKLLIAVRRGGQRADVFIGFVGSADFPEYPRNMVVLRNRTEADARRLLNNPNISYQDILNSSTTTDLISKL